MIYKLQIQKNGDSFSAIFPKKMIADLHLEKDSEIFAIPTDQGMLLAKHSEFFFYVDGNKRIALMAMFVFLYQKNTQNRSKRRIN